MKNSFIKKNTLGLLVKTGGCLSRPFFSGMGHILCFHRVLNRNDRPRLWANSGKEITEEKLRYIIEFFLEKNYRFINPDDLCDILNGPRKQQKFIMLTFDDGYADNYHTAFPIAKEYNIPITIYISTSFPEFEVVLWPYILEEYLLCNNTVGFFWRNKNYSWKLYSKEEKETAYTEIRNLIISNEKVLLPFIMEMVFGISEIESREMLGQNVMTWQQIIEMSSHRLVTIAAHGHSHYALSGLNEKDAMKDVLLSRKLLEERTGHVIHHFAYPYGTAAEADKPEFRLLRTLSFKTGVTLRQGSVFAQHANHLFQLPRIPLGNHVDGEMLENIDNGIRQFSFNEWKRVV